MITGAFISLLAWIVLGTAFLLPSGNFLPTNFSTLLSDIISYAYGWDWMIPVGTIFSVLSAVIIFMVAEIGWKSGKWLIALLRGN